MICTLVGARPQFVKAGPLSRALKAAEIPEVLIHTGQHYDDRMSEVFFQDLDLPRPAVNLDVGSGLHGWQTGEVMRRLEPVLMEHRPEALVVFGDTNSTLAGALTAAKLHIPVVHVEAGLRSFNREMPEEINRVVTDHISTLLLAPTTTAMTLLANEGLSGRSLLSGDITVDALAFAVNRSPGADALEPYGMEAGAYMLATLHRPATVDDPDTLSHVLS
ncbi:MAG: UDP-N-acetylglucosamine 2-epimerase, partial [Bacteroidota bacterium]